MKKIFLFLTFMILLSGCEKEHYLINNDSSYPTIIKKVDPVLLGKLRSDFASQNIYTYSSLDEYGFCGYADDIAIRPGLAVDTTVTESEAIAIAKEFIRKNSAPTGVKEINDLEFTKVEKKVRRQNGFWYLRTSSQRVDTIEVISTSITINITGREVTVCLGNWYPSIYIPVEFNCSLDDAKRSILNRTLTHYGWGGPFNVEITAEALKNSTSRLTAVPVENPDQKEIHIAWTINVPDVFFIIYVDVMTGEVIREEPTIIF